VRLAALRTEAELAVDRTDSKRCITFAVDAEKDVWMRLSEAPDARLKPEVREVWNRCDVDLVSALQVQHRGGGFQLLECSAQVPERRRKL